VHCRIFPPFFPLLSTLNVLLPHTHVHAYAFAHKHVQDRRSALMIACGRGHEAAAAELMEATKRAGALDLQVGLEA
jgi:hypothetical protein